MISLEFNSFLQLSLFNFLLQILFLEEFIMTFVGVWGEFLRINNFTFLSKVKLSPGASIWLYQCLVIAKKIPTYPFLGCYVSKYVQWSDDNVLRSHIKLITYCQKIRPRYERPNSLNHNPLLLHDHHGISCRLRHMQ